MMDVSDGLALDAGRLAAASGVTIDVDSVALGVPAAGVAAAVRAGEDHALLATFPPDASLPEGFRRIGEVRGASDAPVSIDGQPYRGSAGWDPYRDWDSSLG
jgi:thiamine-monophosphate kinase